MSGSASHGLEFLCVGKRKASTFQRTRIHINISHHCFRMFDWKCVIFRNVRIFHQHFIPPGKIKQNPKATSLFFNNQKYFAATMKILKKIQSYTKTSAKLNWKSKKSHVVKQKMNNCGKTCSDTKIRILFIKSLLKTQKIAILVLWKPYFSKFPKILDFENFRIFRYFLNFWLQHIQQNK